MKEVVEFLQANPVQYLATGTAGTPTPQGTGYGTVTGKAAGTAHAYPAAWF